jgi:GDP-L-fucose synthase
MGYAYSKRMLDIQLRLSGLRYTYLIPTNMYGPFDNFDLNNSHVIPALIRKVFEANKSRSTIEVWGNGNQRRQFLYAPDFCKIIKSFIDKDAFDNQRLNVSSSVSYSITDVIKILETIAGVKLDVNYTNMYNGVETKYAKNSIDHYYTSLFNGLHYTYNWYESINCNQAAD